MTSGMLPVTEHLAIPDSVVTLLAPRPYGFGGSVELFGSRTRPAFDALGAARTLAQLVVDAVLQRDRVARLVQFAARPGDQLTASETMDALVAATGWRGGAAANDRHALIRRVTQQAVVDGMLRLAADTDASPEVRSLAALKLRDLQADAATRARTGGDEARAHWAAIERDVARWFEDGTLPARTEALRPPPGDPFGTDPDHAW